MSFLFQQKYCQNLQFSSYFDVVHQRVCRYPLLLDRYITYLDVDLPEYSNAQKALKMISNVVSDLERRMFESENTMKLYEIQQRLQGKHEIITIGRVLLKEGELGKQSRKEVQPRQLYLFNDILLCCATVVTTGQLTVRLEMSLDAIIKVCVSIFIFC